MVIRTIRAVLYFNTSGIELRKNVNWSCYESKAMLTTSTTSNEALNRFLVNSKRIINASKIELQFIEKIQFYEEVKYKNGSVKKDKYTKVLKVGEDMKLEVLA